MESEIKKQAQKLFNLAQRAGLIVGNSFEEFLSALKIAEISKQLSSNKDIFFKANSNLPDVSRLWESGQGNKIQEALVWHLINFAVDNHLGVGLDWKFSADDVVFNIKLILPDLDLIGLGEKEIDGEWGESISLGGVKYRFLKEEGNMITQIFKVINTHLEKTGQVFVLSNAGFDDIYYLLIKTSSLPEFEALGFSVV